MLFRTAFAAAVVAGALGASAPALAQHEMADDYRQTIVYAECRNQNIGDNQCYCFANYVYNNGWEVNKQAVVRIMQAYPLANGADIGDEVWEKTGLTLDEDHMIAAVDLIVNATGYCSKWESK